MQSLVLQRPGLHRSRPRRLPARHPRLASLPRPARPRRQPDPLAERNPVRFRPRPTSRAQRLRTIRRRRPAVACGRPRNRGPPD
ncbi:MAG: hypothetical protein GC150_11415 [Rhizobiales bacterium]|nr:hypothetical protein [Hyphomicrobiales bacterium]